MNNMSYIWQDFNIKTFPAETVVFRDGVFCPELSTLESPVIDKNYELPVHYIYIGELLGENDINITINENVKNQPIYISGKVIVNKIANINMIIKNSGMNTDIRGYFIIENHGNTTFNVDAHHLCRKTGIFIQTKLLAYKNSTSSLSGVAHIYKYCEDCRSDINFSAISDKDAKIIFNPGQRISAIPESAEHSANIAEYNKSQIEYLHESGLNDTQIHDILRDAFLNDTDIFNK